MDQDTSKLTTEKIEEKGSRWKLPGVKFDNLQKMGEQVSSQTIEMAKNTAAGTGLAGAFAQKPTVMPLVSTENLYS